jgi:hypothetical protein
MTERTETIEGYVVDEGSASQRHKAHQAWRSAETIKRLSDRLIGLGPFGIGLDGVLSWVPGVGPVYSAGAGLLLMGHAMHARASAATLLRMGFYLVIDTATDTVWGLGSAVDTLFPGHLMAAKALQKDIESRHGLPDEIDAKTRKKRKVKKARR